MPSPDCRHACGAPDHAAGLELQEQRWNPEGCYLCRDKKGKRLAIGASRVRKTGNNEGLSQGEEAISEWNGKSVRRTFNKFLSVRALCKMLFQAVRGTLTLELLGL
jgi:hypothetical protein